MSSTPTAEPAPHRLRAAWSHSRSRSTGFAPPVWSKRAFSVRPIAAISVGLLDDRPMLDLCYTEDRDAEVDLNVVGTPDGGVVEVQGTAEGAPILRRKLDQMLDLALGAMPALAAYQTKTLSMLDVDLDRLLP